MRQYNPQGSHPPQYLLQRWSVEDNRQGRAPGKQSQKCWRRIDIKFSEKRQPGEPGTLSTVRAGVSQGLPRRIQLSFQSSDYWPYTILSFTNEGVFLVSSYEIFAPPLSIGYEEKIRTESLFFKFFNSPWREIGCDTKSSLSPEILELEFYAVTGWDFGCLF